MRFDPATGTRAATAGGLVSLMLGCVAGGPIASDEIVPGGGAGGRVVGRVAGVDGRGGGNQAAAGRGTGDSVMSGGGPAAKAAAPVGAAIYLPFDEGAGATLVDGSGHGNTGTVMRGATDRDFTEATPRWARGRTDRAGDGSLQLNGVDEWVTIADSPAIDMIGVNNALSISVWVYVDSYRLIPDDQIVAQKQMFGTDSEYFRMGLLNGVPYGGQGLIIAAAPARVPLGRWTHLALTYGDDTILLYVDGQELVRIRHAEPISIEDTPVTLGAGINGPDAGQYFDGRLDDFRMYTRALAPLEVASLAARQ